MKMKTQEYENPTEWSSVIINQDLQNDGQFLQPLPFTLCSYTRVTYRTEGDSKVESDRTER